MNASAGVLPSQTLSALIKQNVINASTPFLSEQIQPASIDLRLGFKAWRIQASFLPGTGSTVEEKLDKFALHELDLKQGAVLEKGCVYLVELQGKDPSELGFENFTKLIQTVTPLSEYNLMEKKLSLI